MHGSFLYRRLPLILLGVLAVLALLMGLWPETVRDFIITERGLIEVSTFLICLGGAWVAFRLLLRSREFPTPWIGLWWLLFVVGLIFLAGEEASWGQHWLGFETPADYAARNRQGETNLHNLSLTTERIPKNLMSLAVALTGLFWPLYAHLRKRPPVLGGWFGWIWPAAWLWPTAAVAYGVRVVERSMVAVDIEDGRWRPIFLTLNESIEFFFILFVLLYLISVRRRLDGRDAPAA